jgi:hypothetical protein
MNLASTYNFWSVAGLVYALAGAAMICNAVFLIPSPSQRFSTLGNDGSRDQLRRMTQQWLDTRVGAVLLAIGFFLQATGALGTATLNTPAVFVLLALAIFAGYYALSRDLLAENLMHFEAPSMPEPVDDALHFERPIEVVASPAPVDVVVPVTHVAEAVTPAAPADAVVELQRSETAA